jgi:hypothetical protein
MTKVKRRKCRHEATAWKRGENPAHEFKLCTLCGATLAMRTITQEPAP